MTKHITDPPLAEASENADGQTPTTRQALTLDTDLYQAYLESDQFTEDQKREMVKAVWNIVIACIDLDIAIHAAQDFEKSCGQLAPAAEAPRPAQTNTLTSQNTRQTGGPQ